MIDLTVFNAGNLSASVISGILAGLYLTVFHPSVDGVNIVRRSLLQGWYFAFLGSILYASRIVFSIVRAQADGVPSDAPRVAAAWILWLLFAACVALGAYLGTWARVRRARRR